MLLLDFLKLESMDCWEIYVSEIIRKISYVYSHWDFSGSKPFCFATQHPCTLFQSLVPPISLCASILSPQKTTKLTLSLLQQRQVCLGEPVIASKQINVKRLLIGPLGKMFFFLLDLKPKRMLQLKQCYCHHLAPR